MTVRPHADDLGLHPAIDRAVFRAFEARAITGASILTTGPTFRGAAAHARSLGLPVGLHLAVADTAPLSPPAEIPSLVDSNGRFPATAGAVAWRSLRGRLRRAELEHEIGRQLQAFADAGLIGDGMLLDGHLHLHLLPPVFQTVLDLAGLFRIRAFRLPLRSPVERRPSPRSLAFRVAEALGQRAQRAAGLQGIVAVPCWGVLHAGRLTLETARAVLASLPADAEGQLICHPGADDRTLATAIGTGYGWEQELATILALARGAETERVMDPATGVLARS